ncbi:MAG: hypothetical protein ACR2MW_10280 [Chthoniobacterales bacterium]
METRKPERRLIPDQWWREVGSEVRALDFACLAIADSRFRRIPDSSNSEGVEQLTFQNPCLRWRARARTLFASAISDDPEKRFFPSASSLALC